MVLIKPDTNIVSEVTLYELKDSYHCIHTDMTSDNEEVVEGDKETVASVCKLLGRPQSLTNADYNRRLNMPKTLEAQTTSGLVC